MRLSITHLLIFTFFVALQIRFVQLQWIGIAISVAAIPICLFALFVTAFTSESKNGMLAVDENAAFAAWKRVVLWSILNLVVVGTASFIVSSFYAV